MSVFSKQLRPVEWTDSIPSEHVAWNRFVNCLYGENKASLLIYDIKTAHLMFPNKHKVFLIYIAKFDFPPIHVSLFLSQVDREFSVPFPNIHLRESNFLNTNLSVPKFPIHVHTFPQYIRGRTFSQYIRAQKFYFSDGSLDLITSMEWLQLSSEGRTDGWTQRRQMMPFPKGEITRSSTAHIDSHSIATRTLIWYSAYSLSLRILMFTIGF